MGIICATISLLLLIFGAQLTLATPLAASEDNIAAGDVETDTLIAAWALPPLVDEHNTEVIRACAEAAFAVKAWSSSFTGALIYAADGSTTYRATPRDHLQVVDADGRTTDFEIGEIQGNFAQEPDDFLLDDYRLSCRRTLKEQSDWTVNVTRVDDEEVVATTGTITFAATEYQVTTQATSSDDVKWSFSGAVYSEETALQGSITTPDLDLTVDDTFYFHVTFNLEEPASIKNRTTNSQWRVSGRRYGFEQGVLNRSYINADPAHVETEWQATGTIRRDSQPWGVVTSRHNGDLFEVWATRPGGEIRLETYRLTAAAATTAPADDTTDQQGKADELFANGQSLLDADEYAQAIETFEQALVLYRELGQTNQIADSLFYLGFATEQLGDLEGAVTSYLAALPLYRELDNREFEQTLLVWIGDLYTRMRNYETALDYLEQAEQLARQSGSEFDVGVVLGHIGEVYKAQGHFSEALDYFEQTLDYYGSDEATDSYLQQVQRAEALSNLGDVYFALGRLDEALAKQNATLERQQAMDDPSGAAISLERIAEIYLTQSNYPAALESQQAALTIWQLLDAADQVTVGQVDIATIYIDQGQFDEAFVLLQQAQTALKDTDKDFLQATLLNVFGNFYTRTGKDDDAIAHYQQVLAYTKTTENAGVQATAMVNLGLIYERRAEYENALTNYYAALDILASINDLIRQGATYNSIGLLYSSLGEHQKAEDAYKQALALQQTAGNVSGEATTRHNMGLLYHDIGKNEEALKQLEAALVLAQKRGDPLTIGHIFSSLGSVYDGQQAYTQALQQYKAALAQFEKIENGDYAAFTLNNMAVVYLQLEEYDQAVPLLREALRLYETHGERNSQITTLSNLGYLQEHQGNTAQALALYRQAIDLIESIQGELRVDEVKSAFLASQNDLYAYLIKLLWQADESTTAFDYAERARARTFLDLIGNSRVNIQRQGDNAQIKQAEELRQRLISLQNEIATERSKSLGLVDQTQLNTLNTELEAVRDAYEQQLTRLKLTSPAYVSHVQMETLPLDVIQSEVLDSETTLIEYFVLDEYILAWVIDRDGFQGVRLDITRSDLTKQVESLRDLITKNDFDTDIAAYLYNSLFAPLKPHIRHANVILVPHGVLHYLPFAALWDAAHERYLLEDYIITYAPSASVLKYILDERNDNQGRLLTLGNPDGSLVGAEREARAVAQLYGAKPLLRTQATESQIYAQAGKFDILHLAAHGVYELLRPLYTRIELAPDADGDPDGNLEVHEILGLNLEGTNLVVLSACETALSGQSNGDELVGLTRAFLYAGAPAIVTTLWSIEDEASGALMPSFYRHLRAGMSNAAALRTAQLALLTQEQWSPPYYWAAFGLTGDYRGNEEPQ